MLLQFCCKFTKVYVRQKYENIVSFDKVIAKIIRVQFFASECRLIGRRNYENMLRRFDRIPERDRHCYINIARQCADTR